ncbi:MAG: 3-methyl-2-oxobutanoate hydroxymethyltransferase [Synergistota bacterium]|nr:3-methyl-2-oxobutanoate hydroxymethyltransferase [Synergistota bacterium]
MKKRMSLPTLLGMKKEAKPITMLTAYNFWQARLADEAGADMLLVGDSLGMVEHGFPDTLPVTMDMMITHCSAVMRAQPSAFVVGDMPFMSCEACDLDAVANAGRMVKESGVDAVKIEGGIDRVERISAIVKAGVAVVGHIGLTPQSVTLLGGYRVQGKDEAGARKLLRDALAIQDAGAFCLVLECVPDGVAEAISKKLRIPTIGIGAGPGCDGQVLVFHDVVTLYGSFKPRFVKRYLDGGDRIREGLKGYVEEVRSGVFPDDDHSFAADPAVRAALEDGN